MTITEADLHFAESLAREAGALLMRYQRDGFAVTHKGAIDLVTTADHASEKLIVGKISTRYPSHVIISEEDTSSPSPVAHPERTLSGAVAEPKWESKDDGGSRGGDVWYIDPLDGTTDFVHHYPTFAVSLALVEHDQPSLAAIYDPTRDELFSARRGGGAWLNGQPIIVSQTSRLIESLLTSGFPYDVQQSGSNVAIYQRLTLLSRGVRISGSAALDLAWVACGRVDGYWEPALKPWDAAAGALIVREAGGRVSDYAAREWQPASPSIVASNGRLHEVLLNEIPVG